MTRGIARKTQSLVLWLVLAAPVCLHAESNRQSVPFTGAEISSDRAELRAVIADDLYLVSKSVTDSWRLKLPLPDAEAFDLELEPFDIVAPDARFLIGSPAGDLPAPRSEVALFKGKVEGKPGSLAYIAVAPSGMINGFVDPGTGYTYTLGTLQKDLQAGLPVLTVRRVSAFEEGEVPFCGVTEEMGLTFEPDAGEVMSPALNAGPYLQRVAIDADQAFVQLFTSTMDAQDYIVQLIGAVSSIYERDNNVRMALAYARLWPSGGEPFDVNDLYLFRTHWWNHEDTTGLNLVHMFSGTRPDDYGGVSFYSNTCDGSAYGIDGSMGGSFPMPTVTSHRDNWDLNVVAHEMGHNHGAHHTHDSYYSPTIDDCGNGTYSRGTIMSYCHSGQQGGEMNVDMRFHRRVQEEISQHVWSAGCHARDCNGNNVSDAIDIAQAVSADVNSDGIPDECQDCNNNGTLDPEEIALGAADFDGNGVPDACEADCNANSIPDQYETWVGLTPDADGNNVPDECDPDCDNNGVLDYTDIRNDLNLDIDLNRILDECQDCLNNGSPDWVDAGRSQFLYICDPGASAVKEFHPVSGRIDRTLSVGGGSVIDMIASSDGAWLYIVDNVNGIFRMDPVTGASSTFVAVGAGSHLLEPWAVCLGPGGDLLVVDYASFAVRRYDATTGAYVADFVAPAASPLNLPSSLVYGPNGNLFVGDASGVYEYNGTTGVYIGQFVASGSGGLSFASGLVFNYDGNLLVSSHNTSQVLEFDGTTGAFVGVFTDPTVEVREPWGLRIGPEGEVLLACKNSVDQGRIYRYVKDSGVWVHSYIYGTLTAPHGFCYLPATSSDVNGNMIPDACETGDSDFDGIADIADNCPFASNSLQTDSDGDGLGDACDNCPTTANAGQQNGDGDDFGDECDNCPAVTNVAQTDSDGDGRGDGCDNCQGLMNADQTDSDGDFIGDACDPCPNDMTNDADGDGLCADVDNCPFVYNPLQTDDNSNGWGDVCEPELIDSVATGCLALAVSSRGNIGGQGTVGLSMDYFYQGDNCAPIYMYDGSPVVAFQELGEYKAFYSAYGRNWFRQLVGGSFATPTAAMPGYQVFKSGQFETLEGGIGLEMAWYSPSHPDSCEFIIQEISIFPADGQAHSGIAVGEAIDWDIPTNDGNLGGYDAGKKLIYQHGTGEFCAVDNSTRFGGQALLGVSYSGAPCVDTSVQPYGAYTALNSTYVYPSNGFVPQEIYDNMQVPGYHPESIESDQHAVTTYFNDLSLAADDTVTVYLILATVRTGTVGDLADIVDQATAWFLDHVGTECSGPTCCIPPTVGDCNQSGVVDITDISVLIDNQFLTLTPLICEDEGDVDFSGVVDITDLSVMIDNQFLTLTPLLPCP